jgi:site-specific DNA recombinase
MRHTLAGFAEYERDLIRQRFAFGKAQAKRDGRHVCGRHPFGYTAEARSYLVPAQEADIVGDMFGMAAKGHTPGSIARELNARRVRSPQGGNWTQQSVRAILANRVYVGERYGVRNAHAAIVTPRLFNRVQRQLEARARKG